jgi:methyltransferase (TIGR00027 family)
MMSPVGLTSRWVAANRAIETECPNPLFRDLHARALAGPEGFELLDRSKRHQPGVGAGAVPYLSIRTRFFDDTLLTIANVQGLRQIVLLAAGMDSRAFRLDLWPEGTTIYEIDRDDVLDYKERVLAGSSATPRCTRRVVRADLEGDWTTPLVQAGLKPDVPTAFLAEGLLMYLDGSAVRSLLGAIDGIAPAGSWLGVDVVGNVFLKSAEMQPFLKMLEEMGCPWRFGTDEPEELLAGYGWSARAFVAGSPEANYNRWPYPAAPRSMPGIPRSYLVTARRTS